MTAAAFGTAPQHYTTGKIRSSLLVGTRRKISSKRLVDTPPIFWIVAEKIPPRFASGKPPLGIGLRFPSKACADALKKITKIQLDWFELCSNFTTNYLRQTARILSLSTVVSQ